MSREELTEIINNYTGSPICIGDLSTFNQVTLQQLLKFVEDNPQVDLYSSEDVTCAPLLSRAIRVVKEYKTPPKDANLDAYLNSSKSYADVEQFMSDLDYQKKLVVKGLPQRALRLLITQEF